MDMSRIVPLALQLSIVMIVLSLGLKTRLQDVTALWQRPGLLLRSLLALNVVVPAAVILTVMLFDPIKPVKIALVLLAISPIPPLLTGKQAKLSSDVSYIQGMLVTTSLLSILYVPFAASLLSTLVDRSATIPVSTVFNVIKTTVLAPLALGIALRAVAPSFAARVAAVIGKIAMVVLVVALLLILSRTWRPVLGLVGNGTVAIIALIVAIGLAVGHLFGGPDPEDRAALALAAAAHHPGVAMAIAGVVFPGDKSVAAAVLLYLLLNGVLMLPYTLWRKRAAQRVRNSTAPNATRPTTTSNEAA